MTSSPPQRRFLPEPVETVTRSSKRPSSPADEFKTRSPRLREEMSASENMDVDSTSPIHQPRRFKPQPIEEPARSSRKDRSQHVEHLGPQKRFEHALPSHPKASAASDISAAQSTEPRVRRFAPEPVETSESSSRRKFAPEPVETTTRSSKDTKSQTKTPSKPRRFAVQPVETTNRSRKREKSVDEDQNPASKPRSRFLPQPISTEKTSSRRTQKSSQLSSDHSPESSRSRGSSYSTNSVHGSRRFSPDLIETAKGTYRRAVLPSPSRSERTLSPPPEEQEEEEEEDRDHVSSLTESRFSAAALAKRNHEQQRRRSFAVPDLPMIESDSGDDSSAPSLTNSKSSAESDQRRNHSHRAAGDTYTDYVLRLAATSSIDKEIQEQAMAAYVNEVPHQAPAHYGYDDDDESTVTIGRLSGSNGADVRTFRRHSQDDHDWEIQEMQRHHAQLEEAKRELKHDTAGQSRFSAAALATRHKLEADRESKTKKMKAEETELAKMRAAASPPMLGEDLIFPQTISPKMTRCETDQHPRPRTDDSDGEEEVGQQSLWVTRVVKVEKPPSPSAGLWGGFCNAADSHPSTPFRTGLQTPAVEKENPFDTATSGRKTPGNKTPRRRIYGMNLLPLTPQRTNEEDAFTSSIDKKLQLERQIEEEFSDHVITQIYNYLSLGYPSLAWGFDEELSKISRISIDELRRDDLNVDAKGYVGAPEGQGSRADEVCNGGCRRWDALRLYVREWARQSPGFMTEGNIGGIGMGRGTEGWGGHVGDRKGSWGL